MTPEFPENDPQSSARSMAEAHLFELIRSTVGVMDPDLLGFRVDHLDRLYRMQVDRDDFRTSPEPKPALYRAEFKTSEDYLLQCRYSLEAALRAMHGCAPARRDAEQLFEGQKVAVIASPRGDGKIAETQLKAAVASVKNPFIEGTKIGNRYSVYIARPGTVKQLSDRVLKSLLIDSPSS